MYEYMLNKIELTDMLIYQMISIGDKKLINTCKFGVFASSISLSMGIVTLIKDYLFNGNIYIAILLSILISLVLYFLINKNKVNLIECFYSREIKKTPNDFLVKLDIDKEKISYFFGNNNCEIDIRNIKSVKRIKESTYISSEEYILCIPDRIFSSLEEKEKVINIYTENKIKSN
ncbi:MAG: hypothetical protein RR620_07690 [Clostridium sp.]